MEPVEREDYQDLMSEIDNLPSPPPPPPPSVVSAPVVEEEPVFTRALPTDFEEKLREQELRISEPITQLEPYEREDYQELVSQIPTPPPPPPVVPKMPSIPQITPTQTLANIGYDEADIEEILERQQTRPSRFFEPASVMPTAPIPTPVVPTNLPKINIPQMQKFVPPPVPQAVGSPLIRGNINNIPTFDLPTMVPRSIIGKLNKGPGI